MLRYLVAFLLLGCSAEYAVRIRAGDELREGARTVEVALVDNCLSQSLLGPIDGDPYLRFELGAAVPPIGDAEPGDYGLIARFVDDSCNVVASGCTDVTLDAGGSSALAVELQAVTGTSCAATDRCVSGECVERGVGPMDGGVDSSPDVPELDGSPSDTGFSDTVVVEEDANEADASELDAGDRGCGASHILYCNDFEREEFAPFSPVTPDGSTATFTTDEAFSGTRSVYMVAPMGTTTSSLTLREMDPPFSGQRWVRVRYFIPSGFQGEILDRISSDNSISVLTDQAGGVFLSSHGFPSDMSDDAVLLLPRDRWTCIEGLIDYDEPSRASLFVDGVNAASFDIEFPLLMARSQFGITYRNPDNEPTYGLFVDDVAIGSARIGCD